jgi:hypothetical protein
VKTSKTLRALALCGCIGIAISLVFFFRSPDLPRVALRGGGEFRVVQVIHTENEDDPHDHEFGGAPKALRRLWSRLPAFVRRAIPEPEEPYTESFPTTPAISIWWVHIHPMTGRPELGPSGDVVMTLDGGERIKLDYPNPVGGRDGETDDPGYRVIWIYNPSSDSKRLRFRVPVEEEFAEFEIANPAYPK